MHIQYKVSGTAQTPQDPFECLISLLAGHSRPEFVSSEIWPEILGLADYHALTGQLWAVVRNGSLPASVRDLLERKWMAQRWRNLLHLDLIREMERDLRLRSVPVTRLKGIALLGRLYADPGERNLSDADILVAPVHRQAAEFWLIENGFSAIPTKHFSGSRNRQGWIRRHESGFELSVDVHTSLYWRQPKGLEGRTVTDHEGFTRLDGETELLHLIVNWVEQDTCVTLAKAYDIHLCIQYLNPRVDWESWWNWVRVLDHERSARLALHIVKLLFGTKIAVPGTRRDWLESLALKMADTNFLKNPQGRKRYFLFKHLTRPLWKALDYDLKWMFRALD